MLMKQSLLLFHNLQQQLQQYHQEPPPLAFFPTDQENMSNLTSASGEASVSSTQHQSPPPLTSAPTHSNASKKKRSLPGNPDPDAEVIRLSPKSLLATNRFMCEICGKGFQRDQNLQLHRRGHNLPWKLKQRSSKEAIRKKVYCCPEPSCVHHDPARALGDLTGIKKHFCRKHGEKKWKCDKCSKKYAVQSDWKAHSKTCGTREYRCDCGTLFSRRDSFITHRAFCDALAEESARAITSAAAAAAAGTVGGTAPTSDQNVLYPPAPPPVVSEQLQQQLPTTGAIATHDDHHHLLHNSSWTAAINAVANGHVGFAPGQYQHMQDPLKREQQHQFGMRPAEMPPWLATPVSSPLDQQLLFPRPVTSMAPTTSQEFLIGAGGNSTQLNQHHGGASAPFHLQLPRPPSPAAHMSATALLQRAAQMGATMSMPNQTHSAPLHAATSSPRGFNRLAMLGSTPNTQPPPALTPLADEAVMCIDGSFEDAFGGMFGGGGLVTTTAAASVVSDVDGIYRDDGGNGQAAAAPRRYNRDDQQHNRSLYSSSMTTAVGTDGMTTRDFLGLRGPMSEGDVLSMAGLDPCMSSSATASYDKAAPAPPPQQAKADYNPWNL